MPRIKVCEFEALDISYAASYMGLDAMGFHIFKHHDLKERLTRFGEIFPYLNKRIQKIILTDVDDQVLATIIERLQPEVIQYYPQVSLEKMVALRKMLAQVGTTPLWMRVVSAQPQEQYYTNLQRFLEEFSEVVDYYLLDTNLRGGTGQTHDWNVAAEFVTASAKPVFLAGGLTPENVQRAILTCHPYGVDVETGITIENTAGKRVQSLDKIRRFVEEVRACPNP